MTNINGLEDFNPPFLIFFLDKHENKEQPNQLIFHLFTTNERQDISRKDNFLNQRRTLIKRMPKNVIASP